ncbi:hypothetical protein AB4231_013495 [Vibrio cyclitrophicus]
MKKITVILKPDLRTLPPVQTLISYLLDEGFYVTLITSSLKSYELSANFNVIKPSRRYGRFAGFVNFNNFVKRNYPSEGIVWVASADTAISLLDLLVTKKGFYLQLHELYDKFYFRTKALSFIAKSSDKIIVPDLARAGYFLDKFKLDRLPEVLPNIPYKGSIQNLDISMLPPDILTTVDSLKNRKIILYQGHLSHDRNLELFAQAVDTLKNDYVLLLVGKDHGVVGDLLDKYSNVVHIKWVNPPLHLLITNLAYIGILKYDYSSLNNIFCAPNKIFEYSMLKKPMLANRSPTTIRDIQKSNAGVCIDEGDYMDVVNAIKIIEKNYDDFSCSSSKVFDNNDYFDSFVKIMGI